MEDGGVDNWGDYVEALTFDDEHTLSYWDYYKHSDKEKVEAFIKDNPLCITSTDNILEDLEEAKIYLEPHLEFIVGMRYPVYYLNKIIGKLKDE